MPDDFLTEGRASARPILAKQDMQKHVPPDALESRRKHPIHLPPGERHNRAVVVFVTAWYCEAARDSRIASHSSNNCQCLGRSLDVAGRTLRRDA